MYRTLIVSALCGTLVLSSCRTTDSDASKNHGSQTLAADAAITPRSASVIAPVDYRKGLIMQALRGLRFEAGLVLIDEEAAKEISVRGDADAAWGEYRQATELYENNLITQAMGAFRQAILIKADEPRFYEGLGRTLVLKRMEAEAESAFRSGLGLSPEDVELRFLLADILQRRSDLAGAMEEFRRLIEVDPDQGRVHFRLATLLYYLDRSEEAWEHVRAAESAGQPVPQLLVSLMEGVIPEANVIEGGRGSIGAPVRIDANGGTYAANETSIASTDVYPLEVVASWNDWRASPPGSETVRMGVGVSLDGGHTWTDFVVRPPAPYQSNVEGDPMTCYDNRTGTLWVGAISFASNGGMYVARKIQGSTSFEPSVMARATGYADKGWMGAGSAPGDPDSTRVYIAYNEGLLRSTDMGNTWSAPVSLGTGLGFLPRVGPNGEVYVAYWDGWNGVMLKRSLNGGVSFTTHTIATRLDTWGAQETSRFPGWFRVPALTYLAVDPNSGTLYCVYFDTTNMVMGSYNVDLYFCKSTNQGTSWTAPVKINLDGFPPGDQFFPWIEVDRSGVIHMEFYNTRHRVVNDDAEHGYIDAYYSTSADGGTTLTEYRLTPETFDSYYDGLNRTNQFMGDYNGLAVGGNRIYPCYPSSINGNTDIFINIITTAALPGDLDGDGDVDVADLASLLAVYGLCTGNAGFDPAADFDGSGCIDIADLAVLLANYGS